MVTVFLSCRHADSSSVAGRIADRLQLHFRTGTILYDVDAREPGGEFRDYLNDRLDHSDIFLAIIGDGWLDAKGSDGSRLLEDSGDSVRLEVATALKRQNFPVLPVLVGRAGVPTADELPGDLRPLANCAGIAVNSDADFDEQIGRLISAIEQQLGLGTIAVSRPVPDLARTVIQPRQQADSTAPATAKWKSGSATAVIIVIIVILIAAVAATKPWAGMDTSAISDTTLAD